MHLPETNLEYPKNSSTDVKKATKKTTTATKTKTTAAAEKKHRLRKPQRWVHWHCFESRNQREPKSSKLKGAKSAAWSKAKKQLSLEEIRFHQSNSIVVMLHLPFVVVPIILNIGLVAEELYFPPWRMFQLHVSSRIKIQFILEVTTKKLFYDKI